MAETNESPVKPGEDYGLPEAEKEEPTIEKEEPKKAPEAPPAKKPAVDVKKINVAPAVTVPLALANQGGKVLAEGLQKVQEHPQYRKVSDMKDEFVAKIGGKSDLLLLVLGFVLIFHGAQFKNIFLCSQVIMAFCFSRVKASTLSAIDDIKTALAKMSSDTKADAKKEPKPYTQDKQTKMKEDAATTKKLLKVLDEKKLEQCIFELCVAGCACHLVMQGGLAKVIVVARTLVKGFKEKIDTLLDFSGLEDVKAWTDIALSFILYVFFGGMAVMLSSLALALNIAMVGAQLVTNYGLRVLEGKGKIPGGVSAEDFKKSVTGLAALGGLTAFGTLWQLWALMAGSGMGWYFKVLYFPAVFAEGFVSFL